MLPGDISCQARELALFLPVKWANFLPLFHATISPAAILARRVALSFFLASSEGRQPLATFVAAASEAASGVGSVSRSLLLTASVAESASAAGVFASQVVFAGTVAEFASGIDSLSVSKTVNANVTGIQLLVSIGDVLVWAVIDDSQNANWQNINNAQGAGWTVISNPSTPGWNDLPS